MTAGACAKAKPTTAAASKVYPQVGSAVWLVNDRAVHKISATTGRIVRSVKIDGGGLAIAAAPDSKAVWMATTDGKLVELDPLTAAIRRTLPTGGEKAHLRTMAVTNTDVWVCDEENGLFHLSTAKANGTADNVDIGGKCRGIAPAGANGLWVTRRNARFEGEVVKLDVTTGSVGEPLKPNVTADLLTVVGPSIYTSCRCNADFYRLDPGQTPGGRFVTKGVVGGTVAIGTRFLWFSIKTGLVQLDLKNLRPRPALALDKESITPSIALGDGYLWAAGRLVTRVDPLTGETRPLIANPLVLENQDTTGVAYVPAGAKR
jgi:hypothetical protein